MLQTEAARHPPLPVLDSATPGSVTQVDGTIVSASFAGRDVRFLVVNRRDEIQSHHAAGRFYETEELAIIAAFFPRGGIFVDIGANVGNHTIYACACLHPRQVIVIEPNPEAVAILRLNLALNGLQHRVDASHLGVGLSDAPARARASVPPDNLGAARLTLLDDPRLDEPGLEDPGVGDPGGLALVRGDDILLDRPVDFLKLDVEGMELRVLAGLERTIARWRPPLFVEVEDGNAAAFATWLRDHAYTSVRSYRRYKVNQNHMVLPVEAVAPARTGRC